MTITGLGSFSVALLWMLPFALGRHLHLGSSAARRGFLSVAAGASIAYVFIDLLPELARMQELFSQLPGGQREVFFGYRVYISMLVGFVALYALDNFVASSPEGGVSLADEVPIFRWAHVGGFAVYAALMGFLVEDESHRSTGSFALYGLAIFFHFWIVDHSLREVHDAFYEDYGRWLVAGATLAGWTVGVAGVSAEAVLPSLMGLVAGGVVVNGVKEELPGKGQGRVVPFVAGAFGYALLLLLVGTMEP